MLRCDIRPNQERFCVNWKSVWRGNISNTYLTNIAQEPQQKLYLKFVLSFPFWSTSSIFYF